MEEIKIGDVTLRTAQINFLEKAEKIRIKGHNKGLLILATGLGKTLASFSDALRVVGKKGKILVLAHNHNLLYQHAKDFKLLNKTKKIGFLYQTKKDVNAEVLFANIMTLKNKKYLHSFKPKEFDYIIIDETHHVGAKSYKCIFEYFKPKFLLGITATPNRTDQIDILPLYDNNVIYNVGIFEGINKKWLRTYKEVFLWDEWCNYDKIKSYRMNNGLHKYDIKELGRAYNVPERDKALIKKFKERAKDRKGIGFCVSVDEAIRMARLFNKNGISSVAIWGGSRKDRTMNETKRNKILEDYTNGKYQMIFNCDVLGEGLHMPSVDVILKLRPTQSAIKNNQHNGRGLYNIEGLKINGNKYKRLLILDFVGNYNKCYVNYIYQGKPRKNKTGKIKDIRNIVELPIGCKVEFEERVIEEFNKQMNSGNKSLKEHIAWFREKYGNKKIYRGELHKKNNSMYSMLRARGRLDEFCNKGREFKSLKEHIAWFREKYGNKKIYRGELHKKNNSMYSMLRARGRLDEFCNNKRVIIDEHIAWFREKYGNKKIYRGELQQENNGMYSMLRARGRLDEFCLSSPFKTLDDYIKLFREKYGNKKIYRGELRQENNGMYSMLRARGRLDEFCNPKESRRFKIQPYKPKNLIPVIKRTDSDIKKLSKIKYDAGEHKYESDEEKTKIRGKIIGKIKDFENLLILESPELLTIKEIENQNKKPKKITIPNDREAIKIINSLIVYGYKKNSNKGGIVELSKENSSPIRIVNTSALQWLTDSNEKYDFLWLDYCGSFSHYIRDLDILFAKHFNKMKLIMTYNLFDPIKDDDNYYFTRVIDYVLSKNEGKNVRIINDVTKRYKKNMYNLGFNISKIA
jgi:superfamily II DNA or RNA helicase